jgi:hypothetical protein
MKLLCFIPVLGSSISFSLGILGLIFPKQIAELIGLEIPMSSKHGISEIRATYGGLFIGMSLVALFSQHTIAYLTLGFAWMGASLGRMASIIYDKAWTKMNFYGLLIESGISALLLIATLFSQLLEQL